MMFMKNFLALAFLAGAVMGCTTVKSYTAKTEAGPARPGDYPIHLYPVEIPVPRPHKVIGVMSIRDTPFTLFGGSFEGEVAQLRAKAGQVGADAVKLTAVEAPDFLHAKYRVEAELVRFTDAWERVELTEEDFRLYLANHQGGLDPIEGIWAANDPMQTRVAVVRNATRPGRDFVAFVLSTRNASWLLGYKKFELASGERAGVYRGYFYFEDFRRKGVAFSLKGSAANLFIVPMADDNPPVIFAKE